MSLEDIKPFVQRVFSLEIFMASIAVITSIVMVYSVTLGSRSVLVVAVSGSILALSVICLVWLYMDPESVRARNTADVLSLANQTYQSMESGLSQKAAQEICDLLLPATAGIAVAITDRELVLGYSGFEEVHNPSGRPITTTATHEVIEEGATRICSNAEEIGFPFTPRRIRAGIIVPLRQGR